MTALVALTATALIMGGTGHPLSTPQDSPEFIDGYTTDANNDYIVLTGFCGAGSQSCTPTAVSTPEQFMPVSGVMPFDQSVGQGVTNLDQAMAAQPAWRIARCLRLLAERANRVDPEGQSRRRGFDAAGVVRVDRQPESTQRRHPRALRRPQCPDPRRHVRRRHTHRHQFPDSRRHPSVRRLLRLPEQSAESLRDRECDCRDPVRARRLPERRAGRRAVSGLLRRHRLLHDPEPAVAAADAAAGCGRAQSDHHHSRRADPGAGRGGLRPDHQPGRADQGEHHVLPESAEDRHQLHHRDSDGPRRRRPGGRQHPAVRNGADRSAQPVRRRRSTRQRRFLRLRPARRWPLRRNRLRRRPLRLLRRRNRVRGFRQPGPRRCSRLLRRPRRRQPLRRSPHRRPRWTRRRRRLQRRRSAE